MKKLIKIIYGRIWIMSVCLTRRSLRAPTNYTAQRFGPARQAVHLVCSRNSFSGAFITFALAN